MIRIYRTILDKYPFVTQAVQTGFLMGAGDAIAQVAVERRKIADYDVRRTACFTCIGTFYLGPSLRLWYGTLQRLFGSGGQPSVALKKVALDQVVFAPVFLASILAIVPLTNGLSWTETRAKLDADYLTVLKANYQLWPWVQLANFYWIPLRHQVLVVQLVALFWNVYVSWKANAPLHKQIEIEPHGS